jgi:hypothetical protein
MCINQYDNQPFLTDFAYVLNDILPMEPCFKPFVAAVFAWKPAEFPDIVLVSYCDTKLNKQ